MEPTTTASMKPKLLRRIILVDRRFQLRVTAWMGLGGLALFALGGGLMYWAFWRVLSALIRNPIAPEAQHVLWLLFAAYGVVVLVGCSALGLLASHRIAGPLFVINRYIAALATDRYPRMRALRKNDEMQDLFQMLQRTVDYLRARDAQEHFRLQQALAALEPLAQTAEAREAIASLRTVEQRKRQATLEPEAPQSFAAASAEAAALESAEASVDGPRRAST